VLGSVTERPQHPGQTPGLPRFRQHFTVAPLGDQCGRRACRCSLSVTGSRVNEEFGQLCCSFVVGWAWQTEPGVKMERPQRSEDERP
jgi:hypothetical protein